MGIRLVYGLQTGDASYLDIFYPSRRLKEAALSARMDYAAMIHCPSDPPSRVLDFCSAGQENHVALLRGELPDSLFSQFEAEGIRVINPAAPVALARDKWVSAAFFDSIGARHPRTAMRGSDPAPLVPPLAPPLAPPLVPPLALAVTSDLPLPLPFVAKPRYGKMGRGVALIESQGQWMEYQAEAAAKGQETIVQEFIGAAVGRDVRFFFADFSARTEAALDSSPNWVCVMRCAPGFLSNAHAGGSMAGFMPPLQLQREAERIFAASGLVYGTVDFLFANEAENEFTVCELNANPGFEELERAMKIDVASAIIATAARHLARTVTPGSGMEGTP
jgi:glutathione synthase/RimK-type ligase-like ATP-grasp enzyme